MTTKKLTRLVRNLKPGDKFYIGDQQATVGTGVTKAQRGLFSGEPMCNVWLAEDSKDVPNYPVITLHANDALDIEREVVDVPEEPKYLRNICGTCGGPQIGVHYHERDTED